MSISWFGPLSSGAAVGSDGAATANTDSTHPCEGRVEAVYVKYLGSPPAATTDALITTTTAGEPVARTILSISNAATDGYFYPRIQVHNTSGTAQTYTDQNDPLMGALYISGVINIKIDGANAADYIEVWLLLVRG